LPSAWNSSARATNAVALALTEGGHSPPRVRVDKELKRERLPADRCRAFRTARKDLLSYAGQITHLGRAAICRASISLTLQAVLEEIWRRRALC